MTRRVALGRVCGIPIELDASWFIILALVTWTLARGYFPDQIQGASQRLYWLMGGISAVLLFGCVLLHELGHSFMAKRAGIPVTRVTLFLFGGVAQIGGHPRRPLIELVIALAGPVVSIVLATLCWWGSHLLHPSSPPGLITIVILRYLAMVNTALLVFNLLPGFPLDGGRTLRAILWAWSGDLVRATRITTVLGQGLGLGLLALGAWAILQGRWIGGLWYVVLGLFLRNAALASYREAIIRQTMSESLLRSDRMA